MEYIKTEIEGVWIIEPRVFNDQRGYFLSHTNRQNSTNMWAIDVEFIQDNGVEIKLWCSSWTALSGW